jgi:hypothetical protein
MVDCLKRSRFMPRLALTILSFVFCAAASVAQQTPEPRPPVNDLLASLYAAKWSDRAVAYDELRNDPKEIRKPEVKAALLDLLDRENRTDLAQEPEFDSDTNEAYAEYVASLLGTVSSLADWSDPRQLCILAHAPYNADSEFAGKLATAKQAIIPCLIEMSKSASSEDRYKAVPVLVQLLAKDDKFRPETVQAISQIIVEGLHDHDGIVRLGTIAALRDFGGKDIIPALQEVADNDPEPEVQGDSIRKYAMKAIAVIQKRTSGQQH